MCYFMSTYLHIQDPLLSKHDCLDVQCKMVVLLTWRTPWRPYGAWSATDQIQYNNTKVLTVHSFSSHTIQAFILHLVSFYRRRQKQRHPYILEKSTVIAIIGVCECMKINERKKEYCEYISSYKRQSE